MVAFAIKEYASVIGSEGERRKAGPASLVHLIGGVFLLTSLLDKNDLVAVMIVDI